ncbi:MAG: hypothetical protein GIKADHBN_02473 [Phycisphaerales bacterium]|nr:hypothetical protein [Phycisphaerales bacterium]
MGTRDSLIAAEGSCAAGVCRAVVAVFTACVTMALGACSASSPWAIHYSGDRVRAVESPREIELVASSPAEVVMVSPAAGWRVLGESRFVSDRDWRDEGLGAFARSIGASRVLWNSYSMGMAAYRRTTRAPVTETARTTGEVGGGADGPVSVDVTTTTERWEERTVEGEREEFHHSAVFLARELSR